MNILEYAEKHTTDTPFGKAVIHQIDSLPRTERKSLQELPHDSECGKDCAKAIDKAAEFAAACDPSSHADIAKALLNTIEVYWFG